MHAVQKCRYPIVVIGTESVGKTSIIMRYCKNVFSDVYLPTMCSDLYTKMIINNGLDIDLQIHDIGGQDQYKVDKELYLKRAYAIIIVFSVVDIASFDALERLVDDARKYGNNSPEIIIVANKIDLRRENSAAITASQIENEMRFLDCDASIETSAKNGTNIRDLFSMVVDFCAGRDSFTLPPFSKI
jgi:small GTP-binding protein